MPYRRKGLTLLEVTVVSGLMTLLAVLLSSAWIGMARPTVDLITRSQLVQEMDLAVAALSRDLGGSLANPEARLGEKKQGQWVGWMQLVDNQTQPPGAQLWLCFDGGADPDGQPVWGVPDTVIVYRVESGALVRQDQNAGTTFTVATNVDRMEVTEDGADAVRIVLTFTYRKLTRTCTLIAKMP